MLVSESPQTTPPDKKQEDRRRYKVARCHHQCQACQWPIYPGEVYYLDDTDCTYNHQINVWRTKPVKLCGVCQEYYRPGASSLTHVCDLIVHFFKEAGCEFRLDPGSFYYPEALAIYTQDTLREAEWDSVHRSEQYLKNKARRMGFPWPMK